MGEPARLIESHDNSAAGFGKNVVKLSNHFGSTICLVGEDDKVWFPRPVSFEELQAVAEVLDKKKMRKALDHHDYDKAQDFADRKLEKKKHK